MDTWCKIARLTSTARGLLIRTVVLLAAVRVLLWFVPWPAVLRPVRALASAVLLFRRTQEISTERLAWAVRVSSRLIPAATCLTQSLALQCLLTAAGHSSSVEIGVMWNAPLSLQSHAWVEVDGRVLLANASDVAPFLRMLSLKAPGPS
jgi:Transglutaminase-like superfamily